MGCRGFVAPSVTGLLKKIGGIGHSLQQALKSRANEAEKAVFGFGSIGRTLFGLQDENGKLGHQVSGNTVGSLVKNQEIRVPT